MSRVADGRAEATDLAQQAQELGALRAASRNTDRTTASTRHHPVPAPARDSSRAGRQLGRRAVDERFEQRFFGGEPVEDRLLAHAEALGQGIE